MDNPNSGYSCADPWETHLHCEWMHSHFEDCDCVELPHIGTIGIGSLVLDLHALGVFFGNPLLPKDTCRPARVEFKLLKDQLPIQVPGFRLYAAPKGPGTQSGSTIELWTF